MAPKRMTFTMNSPPSPSLLRKEGEQYFVLQVLGGVEKVSLHPQTPQGGLSKALDFNKSPLGVPIAIGIGVSKRKLTFSTAPKEGNEFMKIEFGKKFLRKKLYSSDQP
jgi:hypothetical protein